MDVRFEEVIIAAWLHDVGKFAQRADVKELFDKEREGQLGKLQKGGWYSHQHVIYTEKFIEKHRDILPDNLNIPNIIRIAANHHNPSSYEEWLVAHADRLSSGSDRCNLIKEEQNEEYENPLKFYEKPMYHLLSTLQLDNRKEPLKAFCKLQPLDTDAILSSTNNKISISDYAELWQQFEKDFTQLKGLDYNEFLLSLNSLLERYWWCIPSATNSDADISLYQHSKTTAAFAAALYRFHKDTRLETEDALNNQNEKKFLFINGDISGIQKYIFDLRTTEHSAKLLRAKSFQLWALSEIIARYLIEQFDVTYANIITSAGGKFILLVPNLEKLKPRLDMLQCEIEEYFLKEYAGKLSVIISDGIEASCEDVQKENAQKLINAIGHTADICKQKKMQKALQKNGAVLNDFYDLLQKNGECPKCGIFPASATLEENLTEERDCPNCSKLIEIGGNLLKASRIQINSSSLQHFGKMIKVFRDSKEFGYVINNYEAGKPVLYLPYTAPFANKEKGELNTFEDIAGKSNGIKKLAMFKADIDNLGLLFSSSLGKRMSFSRYSDMSHLFHYFFSAYFEWFVRTKKDHNGNSYSDTIYTVFSGGDDLCILGAWDSVMFFACDFQKELCKLVNNNPSITISGGITLANSNIPVKNMATGAEDALDNSKYFTSSTVPAEGPLKNAVTVFGTTVSWADYEKALKDGKQISQYMEINEKSSSEGLSTSVVYKMIDFANRAQKVKDKGNISDLLKNGTWNSNFRYITARNIKDTQIREWFLKFGSSQDEMINSRIAVSYALYRKRNSKGGSENGI
ncbi:MAG TPA: type III-A CRISPR-associated protein Cas10/Csm1 [Treponemataceae bacterium]|nr:type III-A CRISPR-associated protein Cas10/Csm1 [Treponemataceae bacterium]